LDERRGDINTIEEALRAVGEVDGLVGLWR